MLEAVIFDLYETLITQFDPDWRPPRMSVAQRLGIDEEVFQRHWGPLRGSWSKGRPDRYEEVLEAVCEAAGRTPDRRAIAELARERHESRLPPFENVEPAIVEMVDALRSWGLKLGVVTNAASGDVEPWPRCVLCAAVRRVRRLVRRRDPQARSPDLRPLPGGAGGGRR